MLDALASLPFKVIITSNYDPFFEQALERKGKTPLVRSYKKAREKTKQYQRVMETVSDEQESEEIISLEQLDKDFPLVFKIHGSLNTNAGEEISEDDKDSIVITEQDYIDFVLRSTDSNDFDPIPKIVKRALQDWPTIFIGYSLKDYNLRLLFTVLRWDKQYKYKVDFSIDNSADIVVAAMFKNRVSFVIQNSWDAIPELYRLVTGKDFWDGYKLNKND